MELKDYMRDGANYQARAVLAYLQQYGSIGESWNEEYEDYDANVEIGRWENGREQGYIVSLRDQKDFKQLNIAFFEHRNSDQICAIKWHQNSFNSITINTAKFPENIYQDKWQLSHIVGYGNVVEMADWIWEQLTIHWIEGRNEEMKERRNKNG